MSGATQELGAEVLLSVQQALLGMVTNDLRAVEIDVEGRQVTGRFAYDGDLTEEHREIVSEVETLVIGDLEEDVLVEFVPVSVPVPEPVAIVRGTTYSFLRREE